MPVPADVEKAANYAVLPPHDDHRDAGDLTGEVIARPLEALGWADIVPSPSKYGITFALKDLCARVPMRRERAIAVHELGNGRIRI
jgi:hypothetical protein